MRHPLTLPLFISSHSDLSFPAQTFSPWYRQKNLKSHSSFSFSAINVTDISMSQVDLLEGTLCPLNLRSKKRNKQKCICILRFFVSWAQIIWRYLKLLFPLPFPGPLIFTWISQGQCIPPGPLVKTQSFLNKTSLITLSETASWITPLPATLLYFS